MWGHDIVFSTMRVLHVNRPVGQAYTTAARRGRPMFLYIYSRASLVEVPLIGSRRTQERAVLRRHTLLKHSEPMTGDASRVTRDRCVCQVLSASGWECTMVAAPHAIRDRILRARLDLRPAPATVPPHARLVRCQRRACCCMPCQGGGCAPPC